MQSPYWTAFRAQPITFAPEMLSCYSRAGVDPYVIEVGKSLHPMFPLCRESKMHLGRKFRCVGEVERNEGNGSDLSVIVAEIAKSEEGLLFLGVLGVLTEYYDDQSVSKVLHELGKWKKIPEDLATGVQGWEAIATLFGGKLDSEKFSSAISRYTQLGQHSTTQDLVHTDAFTVAASLNAMKDIVRGREKGVPTAYVGMDAGWVAAVAEWLFDLKIELRSKDDRILYSTGTDEKVQLSIQFKPPGIPVDGTPLENVPLVLRGGV